MILKASQRGGGQDLAQHLSRLDDNEHMELAELRGFASDDLRGAFKEAEAISRGTKCRQYLFSLSLSPPGDANVSPEVFPRHHRFHRNAAWPGRPAARHRLS